MKRYSYDSRDDIHRCPRPPTAAARPADGGYPVDADLHQMTDDGCPHGPDPVRWDDPVWQDDVLDLDVGLDNFGELDTFDDEDNPVFPFAGGAVAGLLLSAPPSRTPVLAATRLPRGGRPTYERWLFAIILLVGVTAAAGAQSPSPPTYPPSRPGMSVPPAPVDGQWFFRGDPRQPCYVQTVPGPRGPALVFTNEKGTQAYGRLSRDGRRVTIPDWNLTGTVCGNALVWPNGDYWAR
jgi:hypothetical protein